MKQIIFTILCAVSFNFSTAGEFVEILNGFQIGQYREVIGKELGKPIQNGKYDDGFEYEIYLLSPDTSHYMIFEFSPRDLQVIWSIQLTGKNLDTDFYHLSLGMDQAKVIGILGTTSDKKSAGEYGEKWSYAGTNFSIEINPEGKLSSIKILDDSDERFPEPDLKKIPNFRDVVKIIQSKDRAKVRAILSPALEVYLGTVPRFFGKKIRNEIANDGSGIFKLLNDLSNGLEKVNTQNIDDYEENMRMTLGEHPKHVVKIKNGHSIKEIIFIYQFGKYLLWEIKA